MLLGLRCAHGTFVVAEGGGNAAVNANRAVQSTWETFDLCDAVGRSFPPNAIVPDGSIVTFTTSGGQYLFPSWGGNVVANARNAAGAGFHLRVLSGTVKQGNDVTVALRSPMKQIKPGVALPDYYWVTAEINDPRPVVANRFMSAPQAWEKFTMVVMPVQFL